MKMNSQHILRLLAVIFMLAGVFGGGNLAYADYSIVQIVDTGLDFGKDGSIEIQGKGTEAKPWVITSTRDWELFEHIPEIISAYDEPAGPNYYDDVRKDGFRGGYFALTADITVTTMFASSGLSFKGTFDGKGHTLTFNMGSESSPYSNDYCAPFRYVNGATIQNLKVEGTAYVSNMFTGGIVSSSSNYTTIQNCICSLSIKSTKSGDGSHGGIVGLVSRTTTLIQNCIFNGEFQGRNTNESAGFVGCGEYGTTPRCSIYNSIFDPSDVNYDTSGCATFTRCSISGSSRLYYKKTFGTTDGQGAEDASGWSDSKMYDNVKKDKGDGNWVLHCDTLYLKPFQRYVDIKGWASGSSDYIKSPSVTGNRSNKTVVYSYYKYGETTALEDGAPTEKGHYTVKAAVPSGTRTESGIPHTWPAWESTMHFCVYDPPTKVERDYDAGNNSLLSDNGSIDVGTFYYRYKKDGGSWSSWSTDVPTATEHGTYTIEYYIKGNGTHNDIGSESENDAAGSVTSVINAQVVNGGDDLTITLSQTSYTYDGTAKTPSVTVKRGDYEIPDTEYSVGYSENTNAGTATVTVTDKDGGNYTISGTATFTIEKEQLTASVTAKSLTYSTQEQELVNAGTISGAGSLDNCVVRYSVDGVNYSNNIPKGTDAKTYKVYYKAYGDSNHKDSDVDSVSVTISAKTVDDPTINVSPSTFTYDGQEKKPEVTVKDGKNEIASSEYSVSYSNNKDVGTGKVTITDNEGGNYKVSGTAYFTIVSRGSFSSSFTAPTAKTGLIYNGEAQELLTAGSTSSGTLKYSSDGNTYSTSIPTGTDAKIYKVYYKVVDGDDETDPVSLNVGISPKDVAISVSLQTAPESVPSITVNDSEGNKLTSDDYTYEITDAKGNVIVTNGNKLAPGDYVMVVTPIGNYTGSVTTVSFRVRKGLSFVFTMESDIIAVCLPYDRDVPDGFHLYYFDRVSENGNPVFRRILSETMKGGEPNLLRYVGASAGTRGTRTVDLSPSSPGLVDMSIDIQPQIYKKMLFTGTFYDIDNTKAQVDGAYILQANDTWTTVSSSSSGDEICLEAFRGFIRYTDRKTPVKSLSTVLKPRLEEEPDDPEDPDDPDYPDDPPTAIKALILEDENGQQEWFDLNGHRIEAPQKGVNILRTEDGKTKKVIKK